MNRSYLVIISGSILLVIFALSWCGRKPAGPIFTGIAETPAPVSSATTAAAPAAASPAGTPSAELRAAAQRIAPAVIVVSLFDDSGKLLRTVPGVFISADGRFVTSRHFVQDAAHGVAKTSNGGIYNVSGTMTDSAALDVAVLRADVKKNVAFLASSKAAAVTPGTRAAVVASPLTRAAQPLIEATVAAKKSDENGEWLELTPAPTNELVGAPAINEKGELLGIVTPRGQTGTGNVVRSAAALDLLLAKIEEGAAPRWAIGNSSATSAEEEADESPGDEDESPTPTATGTPRPTPAVARLGKPQIIYNPTPQYPRYSYFHEKGSGTFRVNFSTNGQARSVQIVRSTGSATLDNVTIEALRKWKSTPGQEWNVTVPVTFDRR